MRKIYEHGVPKVIRQMRTNMIQRCYYPKDKRYKNYGGRGIQVCDEWIKSSYAFYKYALSHGWHEGLTIDRIDNDGNYSPENCRFVTMDENRRTRRKYNTMQKPIPNNKEFSLLISYLNQKKISMGKFAQLIGLHYRVIYNTFNGFSVPRDYHRSSFEKFFNENKKEIYQCLGMQDENTKAVL